jgi:hypothetical protein
VSHPELLGPTGPENVDAWTETIAHDEIAHDERGHQEMAEEPTTQVAIRLPNTLLARVDRYAERMNHDYPGSGQTRAQAVRTLLTRALDEVEAADKRPAKGGR